MYGLALQKRAGRLLQEINGSTAVEIVSKYNPDRAPDSYGLTGETLEEMVKEDSDLADTLARVFTVWLRGELPAPLAALLSPIQYMALLKDPSDPQSTKTRPIGVNSCILQRLSRFLWDETKDRIRAAVLPHQFALASSGPVVMTNALRVWLQRDPSTVVAKLDVRGAFDHSSRAHCVQAIYEIAPDAAPFTAQLLNDTTMGFVVGADKKMARIEAREGVV